MKSEGIGRMRKRMEWRLVVEPKAGKRLGRSKSDTRESTKSEFGNGRKRLETNMPRWLIIKATILADGWVFRSKFHFLSF